VVKSKVERQTYPSARELTEALEGDLDGHGRWDAIKRIGKACCPAHTDENPSLDISMGANGKVLFICRVGCSQDAVLAALRRKGIWPSAPQPGAKVKKYRGKLNIVAVYSYQLPDGVECFQVCRTDTKEFPTRKPDGRGGWEWTRPLNNLPYRLPELIEAMASEKAVLIVEGEKDCDNLARIGVTATCNAGGAGKWTPDHAKYLREADVVIIPDNDERGRKHVAVVRGTLSGVATRVRVLELPGLAEKGDVSDWLAAGGTAEVLYELIESSAQDVTNVVVPIAERTGTTPPERDERRRDDDAESRIKAHWMVEPWPEGVDGAELLDAIAAQVSRYMVLPKHAAETIALFVLHAWTAASADVSPFLLLVSPTKRCGKTTLMAILLYLTPHSVLASNISPAAVYHFIENEDPTLLIDEADSFIKDNEPMRNVLNSGHTRTGAVVIRMEGEGKNMRPRAYSTWCPKVIACIQQLADTLMDRGVKVLLRRKQKGEGCERLRHRDNDEFASLRRKAARWAQDHMLALTDADPKLPDALDNRIADNWRHLFAIAQAAGGEWPEKAKAAALAQIEGEEDQEKAVMLLADIRHILSEARQSSLTPRELTARLVALEHSPWAEWRRGEHPITERGVAMMLKPYGIKSVKVRGPADYFRRDFEEVWKSYLPPESEG